MAASSTISQLSCFASINRKLQLRTRSMPCLIAYRSRSMVVMSLEGGGMNTTSSEMKSVDYTADASKSYREKTAKSYPTVGEHDDGVNRKTDQIQEPDVPEQKRAAKIHDFCFGIPYGGLVLGGGIFGSIISKSPATLLTGVLFGGALLALSTFSLKIWRQGKSSFPFILGQAVLSVALLWKNIQTYSLTKKLFPASLYAVISAGMLCFYSYVMISGGNPPPKKLKSSANVAL